MKNILILGAGFVSRPGVTYLLETENLNIIVADIVLERAESLVKGYKNGRAVRLNIDDKEELGSLISDNDIVVSLLPWIYHIKIAELCVKYNRHLVTTSYVSEEMRKLDPVVRKKGLLFLNEVGADPGIDHMTAKKIIDEVGEEGGKILEFYSFCGGLPAPEDNDNPFGYKFSWSPKGVVLASRNPARFLENGEIFDIAGNDLFLTFRNEHVDGLGDFEVYPNRDSVEYRELYGLEDAKTLIRGTYRYPGWCRTFKHIIDLGLLSDQRVEGINSVPFREMMAKLAGSENSDNIKEDVAKLCGISPDSDVITRLEWLGLFGDELTSEHNNYIDILSEILKKKLFYKDNEKDMLLLRHKFIVLNKNGSKDLITSTLIDYGIPGGDSSMSRTVSLPLAISVRMMAEGRFNISGVRIPVLKEIYLPVIEELEKFGISMEEKRSSL